MRVLLPPSETKVLGGGNSFLRLEDLAFHEGLGSARQTVLEALRELSLNREAAAKALKVGVRAAKEIENNLILEESPTMPAIERYTGVLYDALDVKSLAADARDWLGENLFVQSALFGLISALDEIPTYRLSASSRLTDQGIALKRFWKEAHANVWNNDELVIDMRSKDYVSLAPNPNAFYVEVVARDGDGTVRALNHFNKSAKGDFVRLLAKSGFEGAEIGDLIEFAKQQEIDLTLETNTLTLVAYDGRAQKA